MITKDQIRAWVDLDKKKEYMEKLEDYIDTKIKQNVMGGKFSFYISTGEHGNRSSRKTDFWDVWYGVKFRDGEQIPQIDRSLMKVAREEVLDKYRAEGYVVSKVNIDCGWHSRYEGIQFGDVRKLVEEE